MPTRKWQSSSGASKNRILGATRLKSEGQTIFPVTLNDNSSNGFALNVQGSNLVLGLGTSEPFSRLSMGNNTESGLFNVNDTGRLASLAFNETSSGGKFSGMFYNSSITKYDQTNDISSNGIQVKTTALNNFDIYGSGGNLFITDENITTIGGFPRKGITELDVNDYKGIEKYIKADGALGSDDPDNKALTNKEGQSKIVLDVRGSIRTDGYINFFNTTTTTITDSEGTSQQVSTAPSAAWWSNADRNIPRGSVWLQPAGAGRSEGMYYKNQAGTTLRIETIADDSDENTAAITKQDALAYDVFNFFFSADDLDAGSEGGIGNSNEIVKYPYVILKGGGAGARVQGDSSSRIGGTALNIRGKNTLLSDIKHQKGFFNGANEREIFSITEGNMSVTGLSGEEFLIKQKDASISSHLTHPMYSFADEHGLFTTDASGGKVWIERQLLIGPKKSDLNWGLIDIQSTPNVPTLLSYNLDKGWNFSDANQRLNRRYITEKATNSIILLNKSANTTGDGGSGGSLVGTLYDCSNSIIIGDTFTSIDTPKSLIITVNPTLSTGGINESSTDGQQVFDDIGGSIVSGKNNWVYKSPYSLVIGQNNFIDNNQPGSYNATGLNSVLGDNNQLWTGTTNFVAGSYHKVSGGGSNFVGGAVNHIGHTFPTDKERNANKSSSASNGSQYYYWNTIFGYYNKIRNDTSGVNYSFVAGNANKIEVSRGVALGTHAYAGGDIRFAIGINDSITTTTASSGSNSNKFVIDKDGNVGIGTNSPDYILDIKGTGTTVSTNLCGDNTTTASVIRVSNSGLADLGNEPMLHMGSTDNFCFLSSRYAHPLYLQTSNTPRMFIHPNGNVGIGTLDPSSALHIDAPIGQGYASGYPNNPAKGIHIGMNNTEAIINLCADGDSYSRLQFSKDTTNSNRGSIQYYHGENTMHFFTNNNQEALRLMSDGDIYAPFNVGIGTSSPSYTLDVNSTNAIKIPKGTSAQRPGTVTDGLIRYNSTNNEFEGYGNNAWGSLGGVITPTKQTKVTADDDNGLQFYTNNTERLTIFKNGNMTFKGTAGTEFIIQNSDSSRAKLKLLTVNDSPNDLFFAQNNQTKWSISGRTSTEDYALKIFSYDTGRSPTWQEVMMLELDGNVGIGTASPGEKLEVNGNIKLGNSNGTLITDNQIYRPGSNDFHIQYSGSGDTSICVGGGNVGIGTTGPIGTLTIGDGSSSSVASEGNMIILGRTNGSGSRRWIGMTIDSDFMLSFGDCGVGTSTKTSLDVKAFRMSYQAPANSLYIKHDGRVGIGTDSPRATLNVTNNLPSGDSTTIPTAYGGNSTTTCVLGHGVAGGSQNYWGLNIGTIYSGDSYIQACHTNASTVYDLLLQPIKGYVGIGTTSPTAALSVVGGRVDSSHSVGCHLGQVTSRAFLEMCHGTGGQIDFATGDGSNDYRGRIDYTHSDNRMSFGTNGVSERVNIANNGYLGIAEVAPDKALHIKGDGGWSSAIKLQSTNSGGAGYMYIQRNTDGKSYVLNQSNHPLILGANNNTSHLYLNNNGRVGIGHTNPSAGLHIDYAGNGLMIEQHSQIKHQSNQAYYGLIFKNPGSNHTKYMGYGYGGTFTIGEYDPNGDSFKNTLTLLNGKCGINLGGTNNTPNEVLEIANNSSSDAMDTFLCIRNYNANDQNCGIKLREGINDNYGFTLLYDDDNRFGNANNFNILRHENSVGGVSCLSIERDTGRVGIGTTSPKSILNLYTANPELIIQDTDMSSVSADASLIFAESNDGGAVGHNYKIRYNQRNLTFSEGDYPNNAEFMRFHESGVGGAIYVGIGNSSNTPEHSLDVRTSGGGIKSCLSRYGGDRNFKLVAHGGNTTNATNGVAGAIGLYYTSSYENSMVKFHRGSGGTGGYMSFTVNNGTERMRLNASGWLGIGTTSPSEKLHVNGQVRIYNAVFKNASAAQNGHTYGILKLTGRTNGWTGLQYENDWCTMSHGSNPAMGWYCTKFAEWGILYDPGNYLRFYTPHDTMDGGVAVTISPSAFMGIGTTSPKFPLDVAKESYISDGNIAAYWDRGGNDGFFIGSDGYTFGSGYTSYVDSYSGGNQGEAGDLNSEADAHRPINYHPMSAHFYSWIYVSDGGIAMSSDSRIKVNITEFEDPYALRMLRDISCCSYYYKDRIKQNEPTIGFIAQQVRKILPQAISLETRFIPDQLKRLKSSWDGLNMNWIQEDPSYNILDESGNIADVSGVKYQFMVRNSLDEPEERVNAIGNEDGTFTFDNSYNYVFCYGKEVNDFHTLDKLKLFTLNFSATQEIDKRQREHKEKLNNLNIELGFAEDKIRNLKEELNSSKTEIETLKTQMSAILERLNAAGI